MCRRWRAGREGTPVLKVVRDEAEPTVASGSVLDEIVREAARQMLAVALQAEVSADIDAHAEEVDENGHRPVVRNGHHNEREVITAHPPALACRSPIALPAHRRRACRLRDTRFRQPLTRVTIVI